MPIGKIRRATRYISRYREILTLLVRYGLADWVKRLDIDFASEVFTRQSDPALLKLSTNERIRRALSDLGPTYIKLGQALSVRPDLVGVELADELKNLQANVPPDPYATVRRIVEEEIGGPLESVFAAFEPEAVASASIGQAHRARLRSGERVAVKVRHDKIEETVAADLDILRDLAELVESYIDEARYYQPEKTIDHFARTLMREMDFQREARHILNLREQLGDEEGLVIPLVYEDVSTKAMLVMEWIDGVPLNQLDEATRATIDGGELAERLTEVFLRMIAINGFYHADPHPGNLMILDGGKKIGLLDFGMVGRLSARMREYMEDIVAAIMAHDGDGLVRAITKASDLPTDFDRASLLADITDFVSYYGSLSVARIDMMEGVNELVSIIHRHHIVLPTEIVMLSRTLVTLEGSTRALSADFSLMSLVAPYQEKLGGAAMAALRKLARTRRLSGELYDFIETAPIALSDIIERFRKGTLDIHMEHKRLESAVNRLVFGVLTSSMIIGSAMVLSAAVPPLFFGLSIPGLIGCAFSAAMGLRVLWGITIARRVD